MVPVLAAATCVGSAVTSPICQGVDGIGSALFGTGATAALDAMSSWVGSGAAWLLRQAGQAIASSTTVDLSSPWFVQRYRDVVAILGPLALPLILAAAIHALFRQSAGLLLRAVLIQLPFAMVLAGAAIELVTLLLGITDQLCWSISVGTQGSIESVTSSLAAAVISTGGSTSSGVPAFIVLLGAVVAALAALMLWIELLLRSAAIYVAVAFLPLVLVTMIWPALSTWTRRLVETLVALIFSKVVIVLALDLAVGAMGTAKGRGFTTVITGISLLLMASFAPFSLLKLLPLFEASAAGHLEGMRQRAIASATHGAPRRAVDLALGVAAASAPVAMPAALAMAQTPRDRGPKAGGATTLGEQSTSDPLSGSAIRTRQGATEPPIRKAASTSSAPQGSRPESGSSRPISSDFMASSERPSSGLPPNDSPGGPRASLSGPGRNLETEAQPTPKWSVAEPGWNDEPPIRWPGASVDEDDVAQEQSSDVPSPSPSRRRIPPSLRIESDSIGPRIVMADRLTDASTPADEDEG